MAEVILTLNAGSSSMKFALYRANGNELDPAARGQLDGLGTRPHLKVEEEGRGVTFDSGEIGLAGDGTKSLAVRIRRLLEGHTLLGVGHRVVHGGTVFTQPVLVDETVLQQLDALVPLAPLHQPFNIAPMREVAREFPGVPQVACFDTAFHAGHPEVADYHAIPRALHDEGVRRYGLHGLSYEYVTRALPDVAPEIAGKRVIVAHLGSGASLCATLGGKSMDSTMGLSALGGVMMGTRPGDLDPGVFLYLLAQKQLSAADLERMLYRESGLLGVSGVSNDMRDLESSTDPASRLAIDLFVYRAAYALAGLASVLGGIDGIVFTAGIGEHSASIRAAILARCAWMGVAIDDARNASTGPRITADGSKVGAYVVPTNEELMIAHHTFETISREAAVRA